MRPAELVQCIECRGDEYFTWIFSFFFTCTSLPPSLVFCLLVQVACLKPFEECSLLGWSASLVLIPGLLSTYWARTDERLDLPSTRVGLTWQYFVSESYPSPQYIYIYMLNKASLLSENCRKPSLFVIWVLFKLIWEIEGRSEFRQHHCQNFVKKSKREERDMMWQKGEREKRNFGNGITELCAQKKRADLP